MLMNSIFIIAAAIIFLIPCIIVGLTIFFVSIFNKGKRNENSKIFCPNCAQELTNDTVYCPKCGQPVEKRN